MPLGGSQCYDSCQSLGPHVYQAAIVHLFSNNTTAVAIFQVGNGRDTFIQGCTKEIWLTCTAWDVTLAVGHMSGASLLDTANALSCWHLGPLYQSRVDVLLASYNITCIEVPEELFHLFQDL